MKSKNLLTSFKYAINGVITAFKSERNMKVHLVVSIVVVLSGIYFKLNTIEWLFCLGAIFLVVSTELVNTAIEEIVNMITTDINDQARKIKDIAAGAVFMFAINALVIAILVFGPKIIELFK